MRDKKSLKHLQSTTTTAIVPVLAHCISKHDMTVRTCTLLHASAWILLLTWIGCPWAAKRLTSSFLFLDSSCCDAGQWHHRNRPACIFTSTTRAQTACPNTNLAWIVVVPPSFLRCRRANVMMKTPIALACMYLLQRVLKSHVMSCRLLPCRGLRASTWIDISLLCSPRWCKATRICDEDKLTLWIPHWLFYYQTKWHVPLESFCWCWNPIPLPVCPYTDLPFCFLSIARFLQYFDT
jgi:hypothetical protein